MANRLSREKSPYLLEHAENPVDWFPWGDEALNKAKIEDKPVFLSVGYSSCHWCHVMARESFEDREVANLLSEHFVSVKVDREERPDIDAFYMAACQALTGSGGWPLSVFLRPDGTPFFAGTYFPKDPRHGMLGFVEVLTAIARLWSGDRAHIDAAGQEVARILQQREARGEASPLGPEALDRAFFSLRDVFDERYGGFGGAPKFPTPHRLSFLLSYHRATGNARALDMVTRTLEQMRYGGIFDQIGLGFHRYAVDERWRVPHFEKMLADQATAAMAYIEAFQVTRDPFHERVAREIFAYVLGDMTSHDGGFFTAEDADSEGREGAFYLWRKDEFEKSLTPDEAARAARYFGIKAEGNIIGADFEEGMNIPYVPVSPDQFAALEKISPDALARAIEKARVRLRAARARRKHPLRDDKVITALNGLMIAALAKGYGALGDRTYLRAATAAADFVLGRLVDEKGRLLRRYRDGEAAIGGFLDDYAFFVWGLIELYEAGFEIRYLEEAVRLTAVMLALFRDKETGGLFDSGDEEGGLIARMKEARDSAVPSGNSVAALNLIRLSRMTGNVELADEADRIMAAFSPSVLAEPLAHIQLLCVLDAMRGPSQEIVIVGDAHDASTQEMIRAAQSFFLPNKSLIFVPHADDAGRQRIAEIAPFVREMRMSGSKATTYICENFSCGVPLTNPDEVEAALTSRDNRIK